MTNIQIERTNKRNYGVDLLRMVLMFMVVMLHTLGNGGVLNNVELHSANYYLAWTMECLCYCAVNCYALISGYVGYGRPYRLRSLIMIWIQTIVYSLTVATLLIAVTGQPFSVIDLAKSFLKPQGNPLWYVPVYTGVFVLIPALDRTVDAFSKNQAKVFLILTALAVSVVPTFVKVDVFSTHDGYSVFWIAYLYLIGSMMQKFQIEKSLSRTQVKTMYLVSLLLLIGSKFGISLATYTFFGTVRFSNVLIEYTSPVMLLASISLLLLFVNLDVKPHLRNMIKTLSPSAFGVYLIHCQPCFFSFCAGRFAFLADASPIGMTIGSIVITLLIYISCMAIDMIRIALFRKLKIREFIDKLEDQYLPWTKAYD